MYKLEGSRKSIRVPEGVPSGVCLSVHRLLLWDHGLPSQFGGSQQFSLYM